MIAEGMDSLGGVGNEESRILSLPSLFDEFSSLDKNARVSQKEEHAVVELGQRKLRLSHSTYKTSGEMESYSRTTRMDDGKWVTVQIRRWGWNDFVWGVKLDIFDDKGKAIKKDDHVIRSALMAVTGKYYLTVSDEWTS